MNKKATVTSLLMLGFAFSPSAAGTHSSVDCSSSGWGDESCSDIENCNSDVKLGVHAYADDGQADKVHGEWTCSFASVSCTEFDGSCAAVSATTAGQSGTSTCSGFIEDSPFDWNTFKLECFWVGGGSSPSPAPSLLPDPLRPTGGHDVFTGMTLEATPDGTAVGSWCDRGVCVPMPAACVAVGDKMHCAILM